MHLDTIILAGGLGTRLRSVIKDKPKPLALINGNPFLDILLHQISSYKKISKVTLAICHLADNFIQLYKNHNYPFNINFSVENKLLGTGGAIIKATEQNESDNILILNGDSYVDINLDEFYNFHLEFKSAISLALIKAKDTTRFGSVTKNITSHVITEFNEKITKTNCLINAGVYLISRKILNGFPKNTFLSLEKDILPKFVKKNMHGFITNGKFIDIGIPEDYKMAQSLLKNNINNFS